MKRKFKKFMLAVGLTVVSSTFAFLFSCKENAPTVKYTFNTNGGNAIQEAVVDEGQTYTLPIPVREGYRFDGWYLTETFDGEAITTADGMTSQTYYAKWTQAFALTLDANGGTVSAPKLYLAAGENVYSAVSAYIPEKAGLTFGAWFNGNTAISENYKMPSEAVTLTAQYKVVYTVEIYLQDLNDETLYVKEQNVITESDYVGKTIESEQTKDGCTEISHANSVTEKQLSETASENVFRHYFNRNTYTVTFRPNYPNGASASNTPVTLKYGESVRVPNDLEAEGYCLVGWAETPNGESKYDAYYVDTVLQNGDDTADREPEQVVPNVNMSLYAVWAKGYTDMFGGDDYIFRFAEEEDTVYLSRGNVFFKGGYDSEYNEFWFDVASDYTLEGKLYSNDMFAYNSVDRSEAVATLYDINVDLNDSWVDNVTIEFDAQNGIQYIVRNETTGLTDDITDGTCMANENGEYVADFSQATEGSMAGKKITFKMVSVSGKSAFMILNEEERALGTLNRFDFDVEDGKVIEYTNGLYSITLDGYGIASYNTGNASEPYYYVLEDGVVSLISPYGGLFGRGRLVKEGKTTGYVRYDETLEVDLSFETGDKLVLDGGYNAVYTVGGTPLEGYFTSEESVFGSWIITFYGEKTNYIFEVMQEVGNDDSVTYTTTLLLDGYGEYLYISDGLVYFGVVLVLDEEEAGVASLYGYNESTGEYVLVSTGEYTQAPNDTGYFVYVAEDTYPCDGIATDPIDLSVIKSFVFAVDDKATSYKILYWKNSTDNEDHETVYVVEYEYKVENEVKATLTLVGGFAFYTMEDGVPVAGAYSPDKKTGATLILTETSNYYVLLDEENKTFKPLQYNPYNAYLIEEDLEANSNIYLSFDGLGGATYCAVTLDSDGKIVGEEKIVGTIVDEGKKTDDEVPILTFKSNAGETELTFDYIRLSAGSTAYFAKYNENYVGDYISSDGSGILQFDGFGFAATFNAADGKTYTGRYAVIEENVIALYDTETEIVLYFDFDGDKFTKRAEEYGEYLWIDNQGWNDLYIRLDGYGKVEVFELVYNEQTKEYDENIVTKEKGTYTKAGNRFTLNFTLANGTSYTLEGELGLFSNYSAFLVKRDEIVRVYVNDKDWSVLILNDVGHAIKYTKEGTKEEGSYTVITDDLLYYVNDTNTDAWLYEYNYEAGTATQIKFDSRRGYFTEDLESLIFYEYGVLLVNNKEGVERHYYYEEDGVVTIYKLDLTSNNQNRFGFVASEFEGGFVNEQTYQGKVYYQNDGTDMRYSRAKESENDYPVQISGADKQYTLEELTFEPSTSVEFSVTGKVGYAGQYLNCLVVREINEETDVLETYIQIGEYRFDIEVKYTGVDASGNPTSEYSVTGLRYYCATYPRNYLDMYALYAAFGIMYPNTQGIIVVEGSYNPDGSVEEFTVTAEFGEASKLEDLNGNKIKIENAEYEVINSYQVSGVSYTQARATFVGEDTYTYSLYFIYSIHSETGAYAFNILAFVRHQKLVVEGTAYEVLVERVVYTEYTNIEAGEIYSIILHENGTEIEASQILNSNDGLLYIVRTGTEDGDKTIYNSSKHYTIRFTEEAGGSLDGGKDKVALFKSASVTLSNTITNILYDENKFYFVEFDDSGDVVIIRLVNETFIAKTCTSEVKEGVTTHTVETLEGRHFRVFVRGSVIEVEEFYPSAEADVA
ncbi:MAG: InlB B-repeat-containing protein [Clostridia bacterium]|nr:InlB B-repeat-containing protein [Clostridia bacterium]